MRCEDPSCRVLPNLRCWASFCQSPNFQWLMSVSDNICFIHSGAGNGYRLCGKSYSDDVMSGSGKAVLDTFDYVHPESLVWALIQGRELTIHASYASSQPLCAGELLGITEWVATSHGIFTHLTNMYWIFTVWVNKAMSLSTQSLYSDRGASK